MPNENENLVILLQKAISELDELIEEEKSKIEKIKNRIHEIERGYGDE